ncbi:LysR family transcriptional regulator [Streptomyces sp. PTM05]|uniref:LysR family transcriptional regulator n=1 Tax=Streptantibioticus parmotrematis TaxID=2873249 RepID=A0ABS7QLI2_9ACTN|nr:LysR family transcriptional regulator [Streptantibioticus parmotrematis]
MELRQLEYFVAVVEERNFTRAAARLHVVQSAVSAGLKTLERQLRAQLVHRTSREVSLTEAGRALLPRARDTLAAARAAIDAVDEVQGGIQGEVRLGVVSSLPDIDLPAALGRMHRDHPRVRVRLSHRSGGSRDLADDLAAGRLDLALLSEPGPAGHRLRLTPLLSVSMHLVVAPTHPLAGRGAATLAELADDVFVDFPIGYGSRSIVDRAFTTAGQSRYVSIEVANAEAAMAYVRNGLGVAILPDAYAHPGPTLRVIGPGSDNLTWSLSLATAKNRHPGAATDALAAMVEETARRRTAQRERATP